MPHTTCERDLLRRTHGLAEAQPDPARLEVRTLTRADIDRGVAKLRRRVEELQALDPKATRFERCPSAIAPTRGHGGSMPGGADTVKPRRLHASDVRPSARPCPATRRVDELRARGSLRDADATGDGGRRLRACCCAARAGRCPRHAALVEALALGFTQTRTRRVSLAVPSVSSRNPEADLSLTSARWRGTPRARVRSAAPSRPRSRCSRGLDSLRSSRSFPPG